MSGEKRTGRLKRLDAALRRLADAAQRRELHLAVEAKRLRRAADEIGGLYSSTAQTWIEFPELWLKHQGRLVETIAAKTEEIGMVMAETERLNRMLEKVGNHLAAFEKRREVEWNLETALDALAVRARAKASDKLAPLVSARMMRGPMK